MAKSEILMKSENDGKLKREVKVRIISRVREVIRIEDKS